MLTEFCSIKIDVLRGDLMNKKTLEWLKDNTHILKIQKSNINGSRDTLFADKSDEWVAGYKDGYQSIIDQFTEIINRVEGKRKSNYFKN